MMLRRAVYSHTPKMSAPEGEKEFKYFRYGPPRPLPKADSYVRQGLMSRPILGTIALFGGVIGTVGLTLYAWKDVQHWMDKKV